MVHPPAGSIALVTGATGRIGAEIAGGLAHAGAIVVLVARDREALRETARHVGAAAATRPIVAPADVTSTEDVHRLAGEVTDAVGPPSILVNAAGHYGPLAPLTRTDRSAWIEALMVNALGPYLTCREFVAAMVDARWGRVINVSSAAALRPPGALGGAYASSKAALNQMTRHLAAELEGTGVTANAIHPGSIRTAMTDHIRTEVDALGDVAGPLREWLVHMDRTGGDSPQAVVDLVLELVGPGSESINGEFRWARGTLEQPLPGW